MFGPYGSYPYTPPADDDPPTPALSAPPTVEFTAPCPSCGDAALWTQVISSACVMPEHLIVACDCTVAAA